MRYLYFILVLFGFQSNAFMAKRGDLVPSRKPMKNCQWKPLESAKLGIRMLVQDCTQPQWRYVFFIEGNKVMQHRPSEKRTFGGPIALEVFRKKKSVSIVNAIKKHFIAELTGPARNSCVVKKVKGSPNKKAERYTIVPTGEYEKKILAELQEQPRDLGCGDYGKNQMTSYFQFHPKESQTHYVYLRFWDDHPLFDENSMQFFEK